MEVVSKKKHSEWGIVSCHATFFELILLLIFVNFLQDDETLFYLLGSLALLLQIFAIIGGIIGLRQKDRKKAFSILGIVLWFLTFIFDCWVAFVILFIP